MTRPTARRADDRFGSIGLGLFLLLLGTLMLPDGTMQFLSVAVLGALFLGLNAARRATGLRVRWFSVVLGATALIAGVGAMAAVEINDVALFFILLGVVAVAGGLRQARSDQSLR